MIPFSVSLTAPRKCWHAGYIIIIIILHIIIVYKTAFGA